MREEGKEGKEKGSEKGSHSLLTAVHVKWRTAVTIGAAQRGLHTESTACV